MTRFDPALTKFKPCAAILCVAVGVYGCATRYGAMSFMGGVESVPMQSDMEMIVAEGNGFTSSARLQQFVLLKAAQDCLANGFSDFAVMNPRDRFLVPTTGTSPATQVGYFDTTAIRGIPNMDPHLHIPVFGLEATAVVRFAKGGDLAAFADDPHWSSSMHAEQIAAILSAYLAVHGNRQNSPPAGVLAPTRMATISPSHASPMPNAATRSSNEIANSLGSFASLASPRMASNLFALQLGSYDALSNAAHARQDFLKAHPQATPRQTNITPTVLAGDRTMYRLRVGAFSTRQEAASFCETLKAEGENCLVVQTAANIPHGLARLSDSGAKPH